MTVALWALPDGNCGGADVADGGKDIYKLYDKIIIMWDLKKRADHLLAKQQAMLNELSY